MRKALAAVALLAACGVAAILVGGRSGTGSSTPLRLEAKGEADISRSPGIQSEVVVAVSVRSGQVLLAGSNDVGKRRMRVYSSKDGGRLWSSYALPAPYGVCATSDPAVAIDSQGRQYFAFLGLRCIGGHARSGSVFVSRRDNAHGAWSVIPTPATHRGRLTLLDDRPSLTVDAGSASPHRGRLYLAWTRFSLAPAGRLVDPDQGDTDAVRVAALVSHSDDGGRHWSSPVTLTDVGAPLEVRLAVGRKSDVYAVWRDSRTNSIYISHSTTGDVFSRPSFVAASVVQPEHSCHGFRSRIAAQPRRCVSPNPVISVDDSDGPRAGDVYVTYGSTSLNKSQDVYVSAYDDMLHPLLGVRTPQQVDPPEAIRGPDQFLPSSAVDPSNGRLWVCYYQSTGLARRSAIYTCTASDDGGRNWYRPIRAARRSSTETSPHANTANGFGDYEGVAAAGGHAYAVWTDGRMDTTAREEIFGSRVAVVPAASR